MEEKTREEILQLREQMWKDIDLILESTKQKINLLVEREKWRRV